MESGYDGSFNKKEVRVMRISEFLSSENLLDAIVIVSYVLNKDKAWVLAHLDYDLTQRDAERISQLLKKRKEGYPLAYITKKKEFMALEFYVEEGVFIPRPETETLVEIALDFIKSNGIKTVAEIGCGSGAISVSIAKFTAVKVFCSDISEKAIEITKINANKHGVDGLVVAKKGCFLEPFKDILDEIQLVVSNPPYVDKDFPLPKEVLSEPASALFYGESSVDFYLEFSKKYSGMNLPVIMEFSGYEKDKQVIKEIFKNVKFLKDLDGVERFFIGSV